MSALLEETTEQVTVTNDGDHDRFAHYFRKADLDAAWFDDTPIKAVCGKKDVPTRNPDGYQVCPTCREFYEGLAQ